MILARFFIKKKMLTTANIAKQRLKIVISKSNNKDQLISYDLINLKHDLVQVIQKHIMHKPKEILIQLQKQDDYMSILQCKIYFLNKDV